MGQGEGEKPEYALPRGVHINVQEGERVKAGEDVVEEAPAEPTVDAIPGYDEEMRLQYAGGLPEDTGEESLAE